MIFRAPSVRAGSSQPLAPPSTRSLTAAAAPRGPAGRGGGLGHAPSLAPPPRTAALPRASRRLAAAPSPSVPPRPRGAPQAKGRGRALQRVTSPLPAPRRPRLRPAKWGGSVSPAAAPPWLPYWGGSESGRRRRRPGRSPFLFPPARADAGLPAAAARRLAEPRSGAGGGGAELSAPRAAAAA